MHEALQTAVAALDGLASTVQNSWSPQFLREGWNAWNVPAVNRDDLAHIPKSLAGRLRTADPEAVPDELLASIRAIPRKIQWLTGDTVPHIFNGNAPAAVPSYRATMESIATTLEPLIDWTKFPEAHGMPPALARKLRSIQASIDELAPDTQRLETQIKRIEDATAAADALPVDLQELQKARETINRLNTQAAELYGKIDLQHKSAEQAAREMVELRDEAQKLVKQSAEAYRITTSVGLAGAFDQRASRLGWTVWAWVALLALSLGIAAFLGAERVGLLTRELNSGGVGFGAIWLHVLISVLSVAGPIWFAWIATKQIGQRFRLAEDYAFKASVAKAYEGYRREAARIDKDLEARLFASALSRLDEAPLRLVERETHGSPLHEFMNSAAFKRILEVVPDRDKVIEAARGQFRKPSAASEKRGE